MCIRDRYLYDAEVTGTYVKREYNKIRGEQSTAFYDDTDLKQSFEYWLNTKVAK